MQVSVAVPPSPVRLDTKRAFHATAALLRRVQPRINGRQIGTPELTAGDHLPRSAGWVGLDIRRRLLGFVDRLLGGRRRTIAFQFGCGGKYHRGDDDAAQDQQARPNAADDHQQLLVVLLDPLPPHFAPLGIRWRRGAADRGSRTDGGSDRDSDGDSGRRPTGAPTATPTGVPTGTCRGRGMATGTPPGADHPGRGAAAAGAWLAGWASGTPGMPRRCYGLAPAAGRRGPAPRQPVGPAEQGPCASVLRPGPAAGRREQAAAAPKEAGAGARTPAAIGVSYTRCPASGCAAAVGIAAGPTGDGPGGRGAALVMGRSGIAAAAGGTGNKPGTCPAASHWSLAPYRTKCSLVSLPWDTNSRNWGPVKGPYSRPATRQNH